MREKNPEKVYRERIKNFESQIRHLRRRETWLSLVKLLAVVGGIFFLYRLANKFTLFPVVAFILIAILFIVAVAIHESIIKRRKFQEALKAINENEIKAVQGEFLDFDPDDEFFSLEHEYSSDLDLFGRRSIFHYLNRTTTSIGKRFLADWLRRFPEKFGVEEQRKKQAAVEELAEKIDIRQKIQAHGMFIEDSPKKLESFQGLLDEPMFVLNNKFLLGFIHVVPLITLGAVVLIFFKLSWLVALSMVLIQGLVNRSMKEKRQRIYSLLSRQAKVLTAYSRIMKEIENEDFSGERLKELKAELFVQNRPASFYIKKMSSILSYFDLRLSREFHVLFNNLLFWDLHCAYRIEKWKKRVGPVVRKWFDVIGNFDALSSLGNTFFNNPDWILPELSESEFKLQAESIGHPLIPRAENVRNDITLRGKGNIMVVTGPNMAGKTTFLKTLGVNIVLALAGAPVCARRFVISPLRVYTSMKVTDSLDKKLSLFYAELQRLKVIMDAILRKEPVFFLIDEMLKGTNESDRHKGAIALIKQLVENEADGVLATHDLELTKLEKEFSESIANYHFDGYIEEDKLLFDYILRGGICQSSNALELMKKVGLIGDRLLN
jgi:ABC-type multidrug transport system fused ATPase/permease subunit